MMCCKITICTLLVLLLPKTSALLTARVVNGTWWAGRLEILYNGIWSTVCDDDFTDIDAQVACRMLGFSSPGAVAVLSTMYGEGQGNILLDDVRCRGTETSLEQCSHSGYYRHNCGHQEDVGIICNIPEQLTARLVNGTGWAGRLEILYNGQWCTVCDDSFGDLDAQVACRMIGLASPGATTVTAGTYGAGQGSILLDDVNCRGTETSLMQCSHREFYQHNCQHSEDIGIICNTPGQLSVRLVNGTRWAGRLEILYNGSWSTVCDDYFESVDAQVVCKMLGYNSPVAIAVTSTVYGAGQGRILLDDVNCQGTETSLEQCSHRGFYNNDCQHSEDIGILCNNSSPRNTESQEQTPLLDVGISDGPLTLDMMAYPTPYVANTTYHGEVLNDRSKGVTIENTFNVTCNASFSAPSLVTCNVALVNLTHVTQGFYTIVFKNNIGELAFTFKLKGEETRAVVNSVTGSKDQTSSLPVGAIAGGSAAGVVAVLVIVIAIVVIRRCKLRERDSIYDSPDIRQRCQSHYSRPSVKTGETNEVFTMSDAVSIENADYTRETEYVNIAELDAGITPIYENIDLK